VARVPAWRLARAFALVGLCAFGGVMPWVYRTVVEKEQWLDKTEFTELWSMGLILPGATSANIAGMLGYRLGGLRGAGAAVAGLIAPPFAIVIVMALLYQRFGAVPAVHGMVRGITAVAAGLVLVTAMKLAMGQKRKAGIVVFGAMAFLAVTVLQWPLFAVVGVLIPVSLAVAWRLGR
jgi:chromate transporter